MLLSEHKELSYRPEPSKVQGLLNPKLQALNPKPTHLSALLILCCSIQYKYRALEYRFLVAALRFKGSAAT